MRNLYAIFAATGTIPPSKSGWSANPHAIFHVPGLQEEFLGWCRKPEHKKNGFTIEAVEKFCNTELFPEYRSKDPKKFFPILHKEEGISRRNLRVLLHSSCFCHRKKIKGTYYVASGRPDVHWYLRTINSLNK